MIHRMRGGPKRRLPVSVPVAGITIAASTWRWDGNSGVVLVSSGFPLKPGQVTSGNLARVRVYVDGTEKSVAIQPLRGTFTDGSYRSLGIQFSHNLTNNTPISSTVVIDTVARYTGGSGADLTWAEPTYITGDAKVTSRAVIAPTDPAHLCGTRACGMPLIPASSDNAVVTAMHTTEATNRWTGGVSSGTSPGTAIYNHVQGLFAMYCRTGTRSWYEAAYDWGLIFEGAQTNGWGLKIDYQTSSDNTPTDINPEGLQGQNGSNGKPAEALAVRAGGNFAAYMFTAYAQPRRWIEYVTRQVGLVVINTYAAFRDWCITTIYGPRLNLYGKGLEATVYGYQLEGTTAINDAGNDGGSNDPNYEQKFDWMLDALDELKYNLGDYRDGMVGCRSTVADEVETGGEVGQIPNFQITLTADFLIALYAVRADSRIPTMLTILGDILIGQSRASNSGEDSYPDGWVAPYRTEETVPSSGLNGWTLPMHANLFGWLYAYTANATYKTWGDRCLEPDNLTNLSFQTKIWGQCFGGQQQSYSYYREGGAVIAGPNPTTTPPLHATLG